MAGRSRRRHHCRRLGGVREPTPDGCRCSVRRCYGERLQLSASLIRALLRPPPGRRRARRRSDVAGHRTRLAVHHPRLSKPRAHDHPLRESRDDGKTVKARHQPKAPEDATGRAHTAPATHPAGPSRTKRGRSPRLAETPELGDQRAAARYTTLPDATPLWSARPVNPSEMDEVRAEWLI